MIYSEQEYKRLLDSGYADSSVENSNTRIGWVQQANLSDDMQLIYDQYKNKSKEEIREEIMTFLS